jgi:LAS superfamily LD-carboxypeptidase LdcB
MSLNGLLTGLEPPDLVALSATNPALQLERQSAAALEKMQQAARLDGIDLRVVSAYRSFERQAAIWNGKMSGLRAVYDQQQQPLDIHQLSGFAKLEAVLLYSALPGASRHHWGTDLDVFDAGAVDSNYQLQLQAAEYQAGGPFHKLALWLNRYSADFGFFRPYSQYQGGVAAEPWHLSYQPLSDTYLQQFNLLMLQQAIAQSSLIEKPLIEHYLPDIFQRYVLNICKEAP